MSKLKQVLRLYKNGERVSPEYAHSDTDSTFQSDTSGTFHSAEGGTFVSDTSGAFIPILSKGYL